MINSKNWIAALDLTNMDDALIGYIAYLSSLIKPEKITFLHVIESGPTARDLVEQFPELESKEEFENIIQNVIREKVDEHFADSSISFNIVVKEGRATDKIIDVTNSIVPDLLFMGKKIGYTGEGTIPKQILKYVSSSIIFVPENSRFSLKSALVPVDFSEQSAKGIKTAIDLVKKENGTVTAQHIYRYRAQFFPYMLTDQEKEKIDKEKEADKENFIKKYDIPSDVNFVLSRLSDSKQVDIVYEQAIKQQSDIIIAASKIKKLPNLARQNFTDKLVNLSLGVPLLIQKNQERYQEFLKSLFKKS